MNTIINYNKDDPTEDAKSDERHIHNEEEGGVKDDNDDHSTSKPANDTNFARRINVSGSTSIPEFRVPTLVRSSLGCPTSLKRKS